MLSKRIIFSVVVKNDENQGNNIKVVIRYDEIFKLFLLFSFRMFRVRSIC